MPKRAIARVTAAASAAAVLALAVLSGAGVRPVRLSAFLVLTGALVVLVATAEFPLTRDSPVGPALVSVLLAEVILLPPAAAALAGAVGLTGLASRRITGARALFALACCFLAATCAAVVYYALGGPAVLIESAFPAALPAIIAATLVLSTAPAVLIPVLPQPGAERAFRPALFDALVKVLPRNIAYGSVGILTAVLWATSHEVIASLVLIGPLAVTRWAGAQYIEQQAAHDSTVRTFVQAVEIKDLYTRGHSERVARASEMIANRLGLGEDRIAILRYAAILHDVGKLGVPTRLLRKTGPLDPAEMAAVKLHPARGVDVVRDIAFLDEAYTAILHHHERMDGLGYPSGLSGQDIPGFARIIAVADAFDSMTSSRSYRGARPVADAVAELRRCAGSQFDPGVVAAMAAALDQARAEGRPWLGDGTVPTGPHEPRAAARVPSPAEYDHDDPAFSVSGAPQGPAAPPRDPAGSAPPGRRSGSGRGAGNPRRRPR
jgi:HD domain